MSDPLKVPKTAEAMRANGINEQDIETIVWHNPIAFFSQSEKLDLCTVEQAIDQTRLWEGNSVLRGQTPTPTEGAHVGEGKRPQ